MINVKYILLVVFLTLNLTTSCTSDEWVIKSKEININKDVDCCASLEHIKSIIKSECELIEDDCHLGRILWTFKHCDWINDLRNGTLIYTFFKSIGNDRYEFFDVIIDISSNEIITIKQFGNRQLGFFDDVEETNLSKNILGYLDLIKDELELKSRIEGLDEPNVNVEFIGSTVNVTVFSEKNIGAEIRVKLK